MRAKYAEGRSGDIQRLPSIGRWSSDVFGRRWRREGSSGRFPHCVELLEIPFVLSGRKKPPSLRKEQLHKMASRLTRAVVRKLFFALATMAILASGDHVTCASGTRVYSLTVWHGTFLDSIDVRCTGVDQEQLEVPDGHSDWTNDDVGGGADEDVCASTAGIKSIEWSQVWVPGLVSFGEYPPTVAGVNVTCADGEEYRFADIDGAISDDYAQLSECSEEGQYVFGISYTVDYRSNSSSSDAASGHTYLLTSIGVECSSANLDPICWASLCSDGRSLKADEPEFCEHVFCSEEECCEAVDSTADEVLVGVISGVVVAALGAFAAWGYKRFIRKKSGENTNTCHLTTTNPAQP
ncbi:unnamed protein product [Scytosiphon promiscuus]